MRGLFVTNITIGWHKFADLISPDSGEINQKLFGELLEKFEQIDINNATAKKTNEKYVVEVNGKKKLNINKLIKDGYVQRSAIQNLNMQVLSQSAEEIFDFRDGIEMSVNFIDAIENKHNKTITNINEFVKAVYDGKLKLEKIAMYDQFIFIEANILPNLSDNSVRSFDELMQTNFGRLLAKSLLKSESYKKLSEGCIKSLKTLQNDFENASNDITAEFFNYTIKPNDIKSLIIKYPQAFAPGSFSGFDINNPDDRTFLGLDKSPKPRNIIGDKIKGFFFFFMLGGCLFGGYGKDYFNAVEDSKKYNQYLDKVKNLIYNGNLNYSSEKQNVVKSEINDTVKKNNIFGLIKNKGHGEKIEKQ